VVIAPQLRHGSPQLVLTRYGRFMPQATDRDRWEKRASERDAETLPGAHVSQVASKLPSKPPLPLTVLKQTRHASHWAHVPYKIAGAGLEPATPAL
jgi:hypothetical protein